MSRVLTNEQNYYDIANTIRQMKNVNTTYKPRQMASALKDIYSNEVEGTLPLSFEANGNNLLDYRIDGESGGVGDRTKNLVDKTKFTYGYRLGATGALYTTPSEQNLFAVSGFIKVNANEQYIISQRSSIGGYARRIAFYREEEESTWISNNDDSDLSFTVPNEALYLRFTTIQSVVDNIMLSKGTSLPDTYEPYGYKVPVTISGKNLLQNNATSQTVNGVTFTVNNDKSITCNGTATGTTAITINTIFSINSTKISGCPMGGSWSSFELDLLNINTNNVDVIDTGNGAVIQNENSYRVRIRIASGYTCNNLTFYPMIRKADIENDTYEPYIEPTTTNIYLDEPIEARANIPSEYTEVEYIESTGTQYINTNIIPTNTTGVEAKISIRSDNNRDNVFMGCRETSGGDNRYWIDVDWTDNDTIIFGFNSNTYINDRYLLKGSDVGKSFIISMNYMNDRTGKINGITYDTSISSKTLASISNPIYIFAGNRSGYAAYQYSGKLYNLKITDGTNVIKNFIPCYRKSDNVAGLYDLVNNVFYTNQGTGNFIVGPIKENESISLSDTNVDIPTIEGTNVLTIDTTVQPSNVYIQAPKDSLEAIQIANRLEVI